MGPEQDFLQPRGSTRLPATEPRCADLKRGIYLLFATEIFLDIFRAVVVSVLERFPASLDEPKQKCADGRHKKHGESMARKSPDKGDEAKCDAPCLDRQGATVKVFNDLLEMQILSLQRGAELLVVHDGQRDSSGARRLRRIPWSAVLGGFTTEHPQHVHLKFRKALRHRKL